jgi:uncharacterized phage protein gp47/JayE
MARQQQGRQVELAEGGHVVATAEVEPLEDPSVIRASLHTEAGHLPTGTRARLVDAVLDLPETRQRRRLEATLPLGDAESLDRLRARCEGVVTRPAGASCLVDARLPSRGAATPNRPH